MRRIIDLKTLAAFSVVAVLSLVLLTSTTLPSMVSAQNNQNETADRVAKNEQYLREAQAALDDMVVLSGEIEDYEKQKEDATSEEEKQALDTKIRNNKEKIAQLEEKIRDLESLNKALYIIDPKLEAKLYSIANDLRAKYTRPFA